MIFRNNARELVVTRVLDLLSYKSLESLTRVSRESSTIGNRDAILRLVGYVSLRLLFVGPLTGAFGFWFILVVFRA